MDIGDGCRMSLPDPARAVVTGAGSGLGRALLLALARPGARLLASDLDPGTANETADLARRKGAEAWSMPCDVRDPEQVEALAAAADERMGGADLMVNNAGVAVAGDIEDVPLDDWRFIVDVNMWGVIHGCRAFAPRMRQAKRGHILNIASAAGLLSPPQMAPYNVTKAAVVALSETLAADLRADGVGVTVLCPTFFRTNLMSTARGADASKVRMVEKMMDRSKVQADEVAAAALASVRKGELYAVPMRDGRLMWRIKRVAPERFGWVVDKIQGRMGVRRSAPDAGSSGPAQK